MSAYNKDIKNGIINIFGAENEEIINILADNYYTHTEMSITYIYSDEDIDSTTYFLDESSIKEIKQMAVFVNSYLSIFLKSLEQIANSLGNAKELYIKSFAEKNLKNQ